MKKITKLLALLLVLAMVFSLAACNGRKSETADKDDKDETTKVDDKAEDKTDDKTDDKSDDSQKETDPENEGDPQVPTEQTASIVGKYEGTISVEMLSSMNGDEVDEDTQQFIDALEGWEGMTMVLELSADNTYTISVDKESMKGMFEAMKNYFSEHLAEIMGMTEEEFDEALEAEGTTREEVLELIVGQFDAEEMFNTEDMNASGTYRLEGDKLYLLSDEEGSEETSATVELTKDALIIKDVDTDDDEAKEGLKKVLPWTLEKVG